MKVKAKLVLEKEYNIIEVPTDKCNRDDFMLFLKQELLKRYSNDELKVKFELC